MFKVGDVVRVVDASYGNRKAPYQEKKIIPHYKGLLGKEFTIIRFNERINCFYDKYGNSFYPWRLELVPFYLENE